MLLLSWLNPEPLSLFCTKAIQNTRRWKHYEWNLWFPCTQVLLQPHNMKIVSLDFKNTYLDIKTTWPLNLYPVSNLVNLTYLISTCRIKSIDNSSSTYPPSNNRRINVRISVVNDRINDYWNKPRNWVTGSQNIWGWKVLLEISRSSASVHSASSRMLDTPIPSSF